MANVRTPQELADAVVVSDDGYELHVSPQEYRAVVNHMQSPRADGDVWDVPMRAALAGRFDDFAWSNAEPPGVKVVVDFDPTISARHATAVTDSPQGQL